jgi:hypothetical protein
VFINENLLREIMAGIRENSEGIYKSKARTTETGSSAVWEIEERQLIDLILEVNRLGPVMAKLKGDAWDAYFSTTIPDIILKMLGIPESYSGISVTQSQRVPSDNTTSTSPLCASHHFS